MWRSFFLALGVSLCILGGECMLVDRAVFAVPTKKVEPPDEYGNSQTTTQVVLKEVQPPEWAPWSLLSVGAVVSLYSITLARE